MQIVREECDLDLIGDLFYEPLTKPLTWFGSGNNQLYNKINFISGDFINGIQCNMVTV